jgi:hypothetical protein
MISKTFTKTPRLGTQSPPPTTVQSTCRQRWVFGSRVWSERRVCSDDRRRSRLATNRLVQSLFPRQPDASHGLGLIFCPEYRLLANIGKCKRANRPRQCRIRMFLVDGRPQFYRSALLAPLPLSSAPASRRATTDSLSRLSLLRADVTIPQWDSSARRKRP